MTVAGTCNPSTEEADTEEPLGLTDQPSLGESVSSSFRERQCLKNQKVTGVAPSVRYWPPPRIHEHT